VKGDDLQNNVTQEGLECFVTGISAYGSPEGSALRNGCRVLPGETWPVLCAMGSARCSLSEAVRGCARWYVHVYMCASDMRVFT